MSESERLMAAKVADALFDFVGRVRKHERDQAIKCALAGDWPPLGVYIKNGGWITPEMRAFIADALLGKRQRPRIKKSSGLTRATKIEIAMFVARARARCERSPTTLAASKFSVTSKTVERAWAEFGAKATKQAAFIDQIVRTTDYFVRRLGGGREDTKRRYHVIRDAMTEHFAPPQENVA